MFAIPLSAAMRATISQTRLHSGSFVPLAQGGFPITRSYRPLCSSPTRGPRLPSVVPSFFLCALDPVQHRPAEIFEPQLVDRPRVWVEFDRQQIQTQCREPKRSFVDVEADHLLVEDSPEHVGVRPLSIGPPVLRDQLPECRQQENAPANGRIENPGRLAGIPSFQRSERRSNHQLSDRSGREVAAFRFCLAGACFLR